MANAKRRGVRLGRKRVPVDIAAIQRLRAEGLSFESISRRTGLSVETLFRTIQRSIAA
jgi:DNA invertase Pin-like site-specific DNA recombinase